MKREDALEISKFLAEYDDWEYGTGADHEIRFISKYGYVVELYDGIPDEEQDQLRSLIERKFDKRPIHGVKYR